MTSRMKLGAVGALVIALATMLPRLFDRPRECSRQGNESRSRR